MPYLRRIKVNNTPYELIPPATTTTMGGIRLNPNQNMYLTDNNELVIDGAAGTTESGGLYFPPENEPGNVGAGSLLVTEANGVFLDKKSLAVITGFNLTLNASHPAGSTSYVVANNYQNRILAYLCKDGVACLNENASKNTVQITSVLTNTGTDVVPSSAANGGTIIIKTASSVNPDAATSNIRIYPKMMGFSTLYVGTVGSPTSTSGYSLIVGQQVCNESNASAVIGNSQWNKGNSSILAGRQHINTKQNAALFGYGHDTTSGSDNVCAVGKFANIASDTAFVVGNGTSHTARSNLFEVKTNGAVYINGVQLNVP